MSLIIFIIISLLLITSIIVKPRLWKLDTYVLIAIIGAILMLICRQITFHEVYISLFKNNLISPIKILILFISMTFLSIVCDTLGLFNYLAYKIVKLCKGGQISLFTILYISISIITVFTSNDIIILTFTPFIIYLCKRSNINPIPYLVSEFVGANTMSMMLLVGNPTNIVLALANNITFLEYFKHMWYIALLSSLFAYILLLIIFMRRLREPLSINLSDNIPSINKIPTGIAVIHLLSTTMLLAISNYINLEMYLITLVASISLLICMLIYIGITKKEKKCLKHSFIRLPYPLIPFLISMFIMIEALNINGYTHKLYNLLNDNTFSYGITSFLLCNIMNNIPMSVLYSNTLAFGSSQNAIYASIIGSNIGAYLTPLGALAGILWLNILKAYDIKYSFKNFIFYGIIISIPTILFAITLIYII